MTVNVSALTLEAFAVEELPGIYKTVAPSTAQAYERAWRLRVLPSLGSLPLDQLTPTRIEDAYHEWTGSRSTKGDARAVLSRVMRRAVRAGHVLHNPVLDMELPRGTAGDPSSRALDPSEIRRLWDIIPAQYRLFVGLMMYAGLRFGEAAGLRIMDVQLDCPGPYLMVRVQANRRGEIVAPKNRKSRSVPITPELERLIREESPKWEGLPREHVVCTTPTGKIIHSSNLARALDWRSVRRRVRADLCWHDLRHHAVTSFLSLGIPANEVQQFAGHSSLQVTSLYSTASQTAAIRVSAGFRKEVA